MVSICLLLLAHKVASGAGVVKSKRKIVIAVVVSYYLGIKGISGEHYVAKIKDEVDKSSPVGAFFFLFILSSHYDVKTVINQGGCCTRARSDIT